MLDFILLRSLSKKTGFIGLQDVLYQVFLKELFVSTKFLLLLPCRRPSLRPNKLTEKSLFKY